MSNNAHQPTRSDDRAWLKRWPVRLPELGRLAGAYLILVVVGLALGFFITGTGPAEPLRALDVEIARDLAADRTAELNDMTNYGSAMAGTIEIVALLVVVGGGLLFTLRRWRETATLWTALALESTVFLTVSTIVGRDRPPVERLDPSPPTASFPSGHTGASAAFYLGLALLVWWGARSFGLRVMAWVLGIAAVVIVAFSRMYRGMHFLTDVTIGAMLGATCLYIAWRVVVSGTKRQEQT